MASFSAILILVVASRTVLATIFDYQNSFLAPNYSTALYDLEVARSIGPIILGALDADEKTIRYLNFLKGFAKDPEKRFQIQAQVASDLLKIIEGRPKKLKLTPDQVKEVREAANKIDIAKEIKTCISTKHNMEEKDIVKNLSSKTTTDFIKSFCSSQQKAYHERIIAIEKKSLELLTKEELLTKLKQSKGMYKATAMNIANYRSQMMQAIKESRDKSDFFVSRPSTEGQGRSDLTFLGEHLKHDYYDKPMAAIGKVPGFLKEKLRGGWNITKSLVGTYVTGGASRALEAAQTTLAQYLPGGTTAPAPPVVT